MNFRRLILPGLFVFAFGAAASAQDNQDKAARSYDHIHFSVPDPKAAQDWYAANLGGILGEAPDRLTFGGMPWAGSPPVPVQLTWAKSAADITKPVSGSAFDAIGFSFANIDAKVKELVAAGAKVVTPVRAVPGVWKQALVEDPWGVKIELVEDPALLGFHHVSMVVSDVDGALKWYVKEFGGERMKIKGTIDAVKYGNMYVVAVKGGDMVLVPGYGLNHIGFSANSIDATSARLKGDGVKFSLEPTAPDKLNQYGHRIAYVEGPSAARIEIVQHINCVFSANPAARAAAPAAK